MDKVIYEFYYNVGQNYFYSCYKCVVDKETEKMFYGKVFYESGVPHNSRFAINKSNLNQIRQKADERNGLFYKVQVEGDSIKDAKRKAGKIIYDYVTEFINEFINNIKEE